MTSRAKLEILRKWRRLMKYQTDLLLPVELPFYMHNSEWAHAGTVLDIGTGNGYYLRRLAQYFPNKTYMGIDKCDSHVRFSKTYFTNCRKTSNINMNAVESDVKDFSGQFEAIIARLCIQHIKSPDMFLGSIRRLLKPGSCLIVIESCDGDRLFAPEIPSMRRFFNTLRSDRVSHGYTRDAGALLMERVRDFGLDIHTNSIVTSTSDSPGFKELFLRTYQTVVELVEKDFQVPFDYEVLRTELADWFLYPSSYTHLSVSMTSYILKEQRR